MAESSNMLLPLTDDAEPQPKKTRKRKRQTVPFNFTTDQNNSQIETLNSELEGLFAYYNQLLNQKPDGWFGLAPNCKDSLNGMVAVVLEESDLPLSKLVEDIRGKLGKENASLTLAMVKSAVLFVGQRVSYGVPNADADILEDDTAPCLWCWETRDMKLMPKSLRAVLKVRRLCRKKICERITTVSAMIKALQKPDSDLDYKSNLVKASEKLSKVLREPEIRLLVDGMLQKNDADTAGKEAKKEEKLLVKQLEKSKREAEKEKKKIDLELQKEKRLFEKEQKRLQEEAEKDERRREKEVKKQQEEAEREQRLREKEETKIKKRLSVQKQASIMERFLKRSKNDSPCQKGQLSTDTTTSDTSIRKCEKMPEAVTLSMDSVLSSSDGIIDGDIWMLHLSSWRLLGQSIRSNRKQHWSIRKKPKTELFKEIKLTANKEQACDDEQGIEKLVSGWGEQTSDDRSCHTDIDSSPSIQKCIRRKQLLQFDESPRPAFYGIWPKKSHVVGARHPFRKAPDLDYDVDSDEEWEEEDPGESLSDCDKDDEEGLEEGCLKGDDDEESEDGFFVPDGYLSDNEGVQVDRMEIDTSVEEAKSLSSCKELENEEFYALLQKQKYLHKLTESALRKNQPLIISNIMHEKVPLIAIENLTGNPKVEKMCLQALSICIFPGGPLIEISVDNIQAEDQDNCPSNLVATATPSSTVPIIQDSDIPEVVSTIRSCSQSINKVVDSLQQKFPSVSKTQLRNKVREMSDFVDNRWQVKKEILDKVGISVSPEKSGGRMQSISKFFSKRCLPPAGKGTNPNEISPQPPRKPGSDAEEQRICL